MSQERENLNMGKVWSKMDVFDLRNHIDLGCTVGETAEFLMRTEREVREKMAELGIAERK